MCIGGYAVNYYGYHRATEDLDIWVAPTNENKKCFFETMLCMGYNEEEFADIKDQDFTTHFICSLGSRPNVIDVLTVIHNSIDFDEAEKTISIHSVADNIELRFISYELLKESKLLSHRQKDYWDISQLDKLRNSNK